jgi:hypothetical protein
MVGAISLYDNCLDECDPKYKSFKAILHYNKAIALSKMSQTIQAISELDQAL